jgi:hypothetical protein
MGWRREEQLLAPGIKSLSSSMIKVAYLVIAPLLAAHVQESSMRIHTPMFHHVLPRVTLGYPVQPGAA